MLDEWLNSAAPDLIGGTLFTTHSEVSLTQQHPENRICSNFRTSMVRTEVSKHLKYILCYHIYPKDTSTSYHTCSKI